jgi:hypothetical protein
MRKQKLRPSSFHAASVTIGMARSTRYSFPALIVLRGDEKTGMHTASCAMRGCRSSRLARGLRVEKEEHA